MTKPIDFSKPIDVGGALYTREESQALREEIINMRDNAMMQMPESANVVVILTHVIGWMSHAIDRLFPLPTPNPLPRPNPGPRPE